MLHSGIVEPAIVQLQHSPHIQLNGATKRFEQKSRVTMTTTTKPNGLRSRWNTFRAYRHTMNELSSLTDRELADLGMSRQTIRSVAYQSHYEA